MSSSLVTENTIIPIDLRHHHLLGEENRAKLTERERPFTLHSAAKTRQYSMSSDADKSDILQTGFSCVPAVSLRVLPQNGSKG